MDMPKVIETRLDTWKSIADYLGRSARTAQRWHVEYGLPVRHLGSGSSSVFAYSDELDKWLRERKPNFSVGADTGRAFALEPDSQDPSSNGSGLNPTEPSPTHPVSIQASNRSAGLLIHAEQMWESLSEANLSAIARLYRDLVDIEPSNAKAFAGLAMALITEGVLCRLPMEEAYLSARAAWTRAQQIDPNLFEARCADAWIKMMMDRQSNAAEVLFEELIQERPTSTKPLIGLALLRIAQGRFDRASLLLRDASLLSPLNVSAATFFCWAEYLSGNFDQALHLVALERDLGHSGAVLDAVEALASVLLEGPSADLDRVELLAASAPRHFAVLGVLGYALGTCGQVDRAIQVLKRMTECGIHGNYHYAYSIALTHLGLDEKEKAIAWLEESYRQGSLWSLGFQWDPILAPLRSDAGCNERLSRLSYPALEASNEYQLAH